MGRQSPEPRYQQNLRVCGGLQCFKYGYREEAAHSEAGVLHSHVKPVSDLNHKNEISSLKS